MQSIHTKNTDRLIAIKKIAEDIDYNVDILYQLFHNISLVDDSHEQILPTLMGIIKALPPEAKHELPASPGLTEQFAHADCYILAEHLLYLLHGQPDIEATYVHVEKLVSVHGFIKVNYQDRDFYIDAGGIYSNMTDILDRYELSINDVNIYHYTGEEVIDDGCSDQVCKLSELTQTKHLLQNICDTLNFDHGDFEDHVLNNISTALFGINTLTPSLCDNVESSHSY